MIWEGWKEDGRGIGMQVVMPTGVGDRQAKTARKHGTGDTTVTIPRGIRSCCAFPLFIAGCQRVAIKFSMDISRGVKPPCSCSLCNPCHLSPLLSLTHSMSLGKGFSQSRTGSRWWTECAMLGCATRCEMPLKSDVLPFFVRRKVMRTENRQPTRKKNRQKWRRPRSNIS